MLRVLAFVAVVAACGNHEPEIERQGGPMPDADVTPTPPACPTDGTGGEGGVPARIEYCQAEIVLRTVCQRCHQDPPLFDAPFALETYEDTQEPFDVGKPRWQRMREVVESGLMPLRGTAIDPPVVPLTCEEKSTLLGWLEQCAQPEGGTDCSAGDAVLLSCAE